MGHSFRFHKCRYCGISIDSIYWDEECMGQRGLFQREDEAIEFEQEKGLLDETA